MKIRLAYRKRGLEVELPDGNVKAVLRKPATEPLADPGAAVVKGLEEPIGSEPLSEVARGRKDAVIVVSDSTRPVPHRLILPPIIETLEAAGIPRGRMTILVATGLHTPSEGAPLERILGPEIVGALRVLNHVGRDVGTHTCLGVTARGTDVRVDTRYLNAELKILTGLIEPHFMAGFSGGPKSVVPGLAAASTIGSIHGYGMLGDERCTTGRIADNPLQSELTDAALMAGADFICNVTLNEARQVTGVFCGDMTAAHRRGCEGARTQYTCCIDGRVDIAITSSAGFPLDTTFYQAAKGIYAPVRIVRPGGIIIAAAGCADGIGSEEFENLLMDTETAEALKERISDPGAWVIDQWNAQMILRAGRRARIFFYTDGVSRESLKRCLVEPVDSVEEAVELAFDALGRDASIAVIPEGPYVIPALRES